MRYSRANRASFYKTNRQPLLGDDMPAETPTLSDVIENPGVKLASGVALTYHGYKRTGSIVWALVYGLLGKWKPQIAVPVALAQGYGKHKTGSPTTIKLGE